MRGGRVEERKIEGVCEGGGGWKRGRERVCVRGGRVEVRKREGVCEGGGGWKRGR